MLISRKQRRRQKHQSFRQLHRSKRAIAQVCGLDVKMSRAVPDKYV